MEEITANDVIREADLIVRQTKQRITNDIDTLHKRGYHSYSVAMGNFSYAIEKALDNLVNELTKE